jgi:methylmalonyl-CoA decarboxylase
LLKKCKLCAFLSLKFDFRLQISEKSVTFAAKINTNGLMEEQIKFRIEERIARITMCDSEHFNCLSEAMCFALISAIDKAYSAECVGIIIDAECKRGVWSAGHNIHELPTDGSDPLAYEVPMEQLLRKVQDIPIPVIACANGTVWGGACDLCLSCDMIVAADTATFAITPAKIGIPYNASGIMHFINQLGINKAREMFFTANPITAQDALNVGLINRVTEPGELDQVLEEHFLEPLRRNSTLSVSAIKRQFRVLSRDTATLSVETFERINAYRHFVYQGEDYKDAYHEFYEQVMGGEE